MGCYLRKTSSLKAKHIFIYEKLQFITNETKTLQVQKYWDFI